jgi:peptide deformylase
MFQDLKIILYPDPRLKKVSRPVETFDERLRLLATRMLELMREAKGVGLAAPQVGENLRLFVMNATQQPGDDRVYVNPVLSDGDGEEESEEGCLSLPGIHVNVVRSKQVRMQAQDLDGKPFEEVATGFVPRVWQHETDHLNGTLLTDRMGPVARMTHRRILNELKEQYDALHPPPPPPPPKPKKPPGRRDPRDRRKS